MSTITVKPGETFEVINETSVRYGGKVYQVVSKITNATADGSDTTCAAILAAAGGVQYKPNELKRCVKVEGYDPDHTNRQIFTCYSSNSMQTAKNSVESVPGGMWIEMFNWIGNETTNQIFKLWEITKPVAGVDYYTTWVGFKMNYGTTANRSYVLTQQNDHLEESVPSNPVSIDVTHMHDVKISGKFVCPAPLPVGFYVPINTFNLYRSNVGADGVAAYQRVPLSPVSTLPNNIGTAFGTLPHAAYAFVNDYSSQYGWYIVDTVQPWQLQETLPSLDWDAPPARSLMGLTSWRNGMMAAFAGNLVYFCEPFRPFAWPGAYTIAIPRNVLALAVDENALIAITDGEPYILTGTHPSNVVYERLQNVESGLKPTPNAGGFTGPTRAVTRSPAGIIYASAESPILISSGRARDLGRPLFTREEWANRYRRSFGVMHLAYSDGKLLCYFTDSTSGFLLNIDDASPQLVEHWPADTVVGDFILPHDDSLYVVTQSGGKSKVSRFLDETTDRVVLYYATRDVEEPQPINFGALQIIGWGNGYALDVAVFADGKQRDVIPVTFDTDGAYQDGAKGYTFRLSSGYKARRWRVQLTSRADVSVRQVILASTMSELASV
jgi:hypothetical protein